MTNDADFDSLNDSPSESTEGRRKPAKSARDKIKDLLASRPHSEYELQQKLSALYPAGEVEDAIALARERRWLSSDEEVAELTASTLSRKRKGHALINQLLESKGLPPVAKDPEEEIQKALAILAAKLPIGVSFDYEIEKKIYRLLGNRGFDEETILAAVERVKKQSS